MGRKKTCVFCGNAAGPDNPYFCSNAWADLKAMRPRNKSIQPITERLQAAVPGTAEHFAAIGDAIHAIHASKGGKKRAKKYSDEQLAQQAKQSRKTAIAKGTVKKTIDAAQAATKKRHIEAKKTRPVK